MKPVLKLLEEEEEVVVEEEEEEVEEEEAVEEEEEEVGGGARLAFSLGLAPKNALNVPCVPFELPEKSGFFGILPCGAGGQCCSVGLNVRYRN